MSRTWTPRIFAVVNFLDSYGCWISPWLPCRQRTQLLFLFSCASNDQTECRNYERSCSRSSTLRWNLGTSGAAFQSSTARDSGMCTLPSNKILCCACGSALCAAQARNGTHGSISELLLSMVSVDHAAHTHASGICLLGALSRLDSLQHYYTVYGI